MEIIVILIGICTGSLLSALVGIFGSRRKIGFGWAFLLSLLFTPIIGIICVLVSDPLPKGEKKWGCLLPLLIIFLLSIILVSIAIFIIGIPVFLSLFN